MIRHEAITLDVVNLTDDQIVMLLRSCEDGSRKIRARDYHPTMQDDTMIDPARFGRSFRCLENGELLAREAWRRGLLSIVKGEEK